MGQDISKDENKNLIIQRISHEKFENSQEISQEMCK